MEYRSGILNDASELRQFLNGIPQHELVGVPVNVDTTNASNNLENCQCEVFITTGDEESLMEITFA